MAGKIALGILITIGVVVALGLIATLLAGGYCFDHC